MVIDLKSAKGNRNIPSFKIWTHALIEIFPGGEWKIVKSWTTPAKDEKVIRKTKKIIKDSFTEDIDEEETLG